MRGRIQRLINFLVHASVHRPYYALRNTEVVWGKLLNREGRKLYRAHPSALNTLQKTLLGELKDEGICSTTLEELFHEKPLLDELHGHAFGLLSSASRRTKKAYLKFLFERVPLLDMGNPFVALALEGRILDIVNAYMGLWSKFRAFTLNLTAPMPDGAKEIYSQRWHRDSEDKRIVKVFLYLNDVDESAGPFMYILGSHYGGKWSKIFPQDPPYGSYPPQGAVEKIIPESDFKACTGPAGAIIFCDTTGLHKGGHAKSGERLMFTAVYTSKGCVNPLEYSYPENFERSIMKLGAAQRYALRN